MHGTYGVEENCKGGRETSQFHTAQRAGVILSEPAAQTLLMKPVGRKLLLDDIMRSRDLRMLTHREQPSYLLLSELRKANTASVNCGTKKNEFEFDTAFFCNTTTCYLDPANHRFAYRFDRGRMLWDVCWAYKFREKKIVLNKK